MDWKNRLERAQKRNSTVPQIGKTKVFSQKKRALDTGASNICSALDFITDIHTDTLKRKYFFGTIVFFSVIACLFSFKVAYTHMFPDLIEFRDTQVIISTFLSFSTVLLTLGLLLVTWKYVNLTGRMLNEMRESRSYETEPLVSVYLWPWLRDKDHPEQVSDYLSKVVIRNVGKVPILDPSLHFEHFPPEGYQSCGSTQSVGDSDRAATIMPGEEITLLWGCSRESIAAYFKIPKPDQPFTVLRFRFRDQYSQHFSVTQDYLLFGNKESLNLSMQCEFISSPSEYRWRITPYGSDIWVTA